MTFVGDSESVHNLKTHISLKVANGWAAVEAQRQSTRLIIWRFWVRILPGAGLFLLLLLLAISSLYLFLLSFTSGMSLIRSLKEVHL